MLNKILTSVFILLLAGCAGIPTQEATQSNEATIESTTTITKVDETPITTTNSDNNSELSWTTEDGDLHIKLKYEGDTEKTTSNNNTVDFKEENLTPKILETKHGTSIVEVNIKQVDKSKLTAMQIEALSMGLSLKRFEQLKQDFTYWEDLKNMIYLDPEGMLVVGPAFSLSTKLKNGKRELLPLDKINQMFKEAGIHQLSEANYYCMADMNGSVNYEVRRGTLSRFLNRAEKTYSHGLYKLSDVTKQKRCTDNNYVLSDEEVHALLEYSVIDIYRNVRSSAKKLNINLNKLDFEILEVVIELFYRGGKNLVLGIGTPSINNALINNDKVAFGKEVYARSNGNELWQNDLRNAAMMQRIKRALNFEQNRELDEFIATSPLARKVNKRLLKMFTKQKHFADDATRLFVKKLVSMDRKVGFQVAALF